MSSSELSIEPSSSRKDKNVAEREKDEFLVSRPATAKWVIQILHPSLHPSVLSFGRLTCWDIRGDLRLPQDIGPIGLGVYYPYILDPLDIIPFIGNIDQISYGIYRRYPLMLDT
eukprot:6213163-Pleurochrysis_carterae.AAC.2